MSWTPRRNVPGRSPDYLEQGKKAKSRYCNIHIYVSAKNIAELIFLHV